jgi:hypothetical protein
MTGRKLVTEMCASDKEKFNKKSLVEDRENQELYICEQGCGSVSAWIRIHLDVLDPFGCPQKGFYTFVGMFF